MLMAGTFLQNRYEIISCIGSGGMAYVYKAKDHKLNRYVAVKILKSEFKNDNVFISKFRVEAQAAAGLAHANIVNVYDVGEDNGVSFIVMELVEGITLKDYIGKKGKLSVREATSIALQVAAGLEAAHNNGIIHRDVKPQNIILSMDGVAKIADFGIARAASSNTINSSVMGSVHYSSPEQTRGGYSDAKSDIYSMGITMYEMVTGRVPFDGDSTVSVALKHLQEEIQPPAKLVPSIPFSTEQIILKCTQKSPDRRYNNMGELIRDLKESLVNPDGNFVTIPVLDSNAHTVMLSKEELSRIKNEALPTYDDAINTGAYNTGNYRSNVYGGNYQQPSYHQGYVQNDPYHQGHQVHQYNSDTYLDDEDDGLDDEFSYDDELERDERAGRERRGRIAKRASSAERSERIITIVSIVAAVIVGTVVVILLIKSLGIFKTKKPEQNSGNPVSTEAVTEQKEELVKVPSLLGKTEAEIQKELKALNLGYKYQGESPSSEYEKGKVVSQSVEPDAEVDRNTTIGYVLSSGSTEELSVPSLANVSAEEAQKTLTGMGLQVQIDNSRYSDTVAAGYVITTNPGSDSSVKAGDTVTIYVSQGQENNSVVVPQVVNHYVDDATTALNNLGLYVYITEMSSSEVDKDIVMYQDVEAGSQVPAGTTITITVSTGPQQPDIVINPEGTWMCNAQLRTPDGYNGEPVRIVLEQNGQTTQIYEGYTSFPYILNVAGQSGVTTGTAYVYTLNPSTWEITSTTVYDGIIFSRID